MQNCTEISFRNIEVNERWRNLHVWWPFQVRREGRTTFLIRAQKYDI